MKKIIFMSLSLCALMSFPEGLYAKTVKGQVFERSGSEELPLIGATIFWEGFSQGTVSDGEGRFSLSRPKGASTIVTSFVGMVSDTTKVEMGEELRIVLSQQSQSIGEVVVQSKGSNLIPRSIAGKAELITFAGLCKMACCNLAESFENSASATVAYSDAVSGARQIRLLGLAGVYTQMLDENRPMMRVFSAPYGLSYTPGMWLQSIQLSKGISSVVNGPEAFAGQINLEYRKPTDDTPLFVNGYFSNDMRTELNVAAAHQLNEKLSSVVLLHGSIDNKPTDMNDDGFRDIPTTKQINFSSRWLYKASNGVQMRWGVSALAERRVGGQVDYNPSQDKLSTSIYGSLINNEQISSYFKIGAPVGSQRLFKVKSADQDTDSADHQEPDVESRQDNVAFVVDYTYHNVDSYFGVKQQLGSQNSVNTNLMYEYNPALKSKFLFGVSGTFDLVDEKIHDRWMDGGMKEQLITLDRDESRLGAYGEYTYNAAGKVSFILGARSDWSNIYGFMFTPRSNVKVDFTPNTTLRVSAGRGFRTANPISDNIGIMGTGRQIVIADGVKAQDRGWTYGGSLTQYFGKQKSNYISVDVFRSDFQNQLIADFEQSTSQTMLYATDRSYSNTYQFDFSIEPVDRFTVFASYRWNESRIKLEKWGMVDKPLTDAFKALVNVQYATRLNKWTFDITAQMNGSSRIPSLTGDTFTTEYSKAYPMFFAQVTKKFRMFDLYAGCENIGNYTQKVPIISPDNPFSTAFNSAIVYAPLMGRKFYAGFRFNIN